MKKILLVAALTLAVSGQAMAQGDFFIDGRFTAMDPVKIDKTNQFYKEMSWGIPLDAGQFYEACNKLEGKMSVSASQMASGAMLRLDCAHGFVRSVRVEVNANGRSFEITAEANEDGNKRSNGVVLMNKQEFDEVFEPILPCAKGCAEFVKKPNAWQEKGNGMAEKYITIKPGSAVEVGQVSAVQGRRGQGAAKAKEMTVTEIAATGIPRGDTRTLEAVAKYVNNDYKQQESIAYAPSQSFGWVRSNMLQIHDGNCEFGQKSSTALNANKGEEDSSFTYSETCKYKDGGFVTITRDHYMTNSAFKKCGGQFARTVVSGKFSPLMLNEKTYLHQYRTDANTVSWDKTYIETQGKEGAITIEARPEIFTYCKGN